MVACAYCEIVVLISIAFKKFALGLFILFRSLFFLNINENEEVFVRILIQIYFRMMISLQVLWLELKIST